MTMDEITTLRAHYAPVIQKQLQGFDVKIPYTAVISYQRLMSSVNGILFYMDVTFEGQMNLDELKDVIGAFDYFCCCEDDDGPVLDGYRFLIGDGDDDNAVKFENGKFRIWVRGWK